MTTTKQKRTQNYAIWSITTCKIRLICCMRIVDEERFSIILCRLSRARKIFALHIVTLNAILEAIQAE